MLALAFKILLYVDILTVFTIKNSTGLLNPTNADTVTTMTRAQQTISLALLASSVSFPLHATTRNHTDVLILQLYLACFLHIVPFTKTVQDEIIPVVWSSPAPLYGSPLLLQALTVPAIVPFLGPRFLRILSPFQAGMGRLHIQ